jgi:predicted RNase H-like nuclease (RuvC/YqgF family)
MNKSSSNAAIPVGGSTDKSSDNPGPLEMLERAEAELVLKIDSKKQELEEVQKKCESLFKEINKEFTEFRTRSSWDFVDQWGSLDYHGVGSHDAVASKMKKHVVEYKKYKKDLENKLAEYNREIEVCEKYLPKFERKEAELERLEKRYTEVNNEISELKGKYSRYFDQGASYHGASSLDD